MGTLRNHSTISDSRLKTMTTNHFNWYRSDPEKYKKLRGLMLCGIGIVKQPASQPTVYVTATEEDASYFGTTTCHSPWACPVCSPKAMAKRGADIACLIDAKATWYKEHAFMVTLTLPHTINTSLKETFNLLTNSWHKMLNKGCKGYTKKYTLKLDVDEKNTRGGHAAGKKGTIREYEISATPFNKFRQDFQIKSMVRVYEVTWGKHGWHPHLHILFFTKAENFPKLVEREDELTDAWLDIVKNVHKQMKTQSDEKLDELYAEYKYRPVTGHRAFFISKDKNNVARKIDSSHYISGWGGDSEMTHSSVKTGDKRDPEFATLTMWDILENAKQATDSKEKWKWLEIFTEYAIETRGRRRVNFTPSDRHIIRKWKQTQRYIETVKKNITEKVQKKRVVFWFNEQQWNTILLTETQIEPQIRADILYLARGDPTGKKIVEYLAEFQIDVLENLNLDNPNTRLRWKDCEVIENHIINHTMDKALAC